jgi:hypothetical protein
MTVAVGRHEADCKYLGDRPFYNLKVLEFVIRVWCLGYKCGARLRNCGCGECGAELECVGACWSKVER